MSAEEAWDAWRLNGAKRFFSVTAEGQDFTPSLEYCSSLARESHRTSPSLLCSASTVTSTILNTTSVCSGGGGEYTLCMSTSWPVSAVHYMSAEPKPAYTTVWTGPPHQPTRCNARRTLWSPSDMFFSCLFPKNQSTAASSIVPYIEYSVIN